MFEQLELHRHIIYMCFRSSLFNLKFIFLSAGHGSQLTVLTATFARQGVRSSSGWNGPDLL
jgi:hypothetical protein